MTGGGTGDLSRRSFSEGGKPVTEGVALPGKPNRQIYFTRTVVSFSTRNNAGSA